MPTWSSVFGWEEREKRIHPVFFVQLSSSFSCFLFLPLAFYYISSCSPLSLVVTEYYHLCSYAHFCGTDKAQYFYLLLLTKEELQRYHIDTLTVLFQLKVTHKPYSIFKQY